VPTPATTRCLLIGHPHGSVRSTRLRRIQSQQVGRSNGTKVLYMPREDRLCERCGNTSYIKRISQAALSRYPR
jgi:ribosomal protein S14